MASYYLLSLWLTLIDKNQQYCFCTLATLIIVIAACMQTISYFQIGVKQEVIL